MGEGPLTFLEAGTVFHDRYEIVRVIEAGGMGVVYEVLDAGTQHRRALKVMRPDLALDQDMRARFELETRVTANIESSHLVETFDAGLDQASGAPFLVMELLKGEDLRALTRTRGPLPHAEIADLLDQAAAALDRTHDAGVVHRDLKPSNLFMAEREDGSKRLMILDFGIAKLIAQSTDSIHTTRSVGTPVFMSPEQVKGEGTIDHRADVYALAHIAYALATGEPYWEKEARASGAVYPLLLKIADGHTEPASKRAYERGIELANGYDGWFDKGAARAPFERFDSAGELARAFGRLGKDPPARRATARRSHGLLYGGVAIGCGVIAVSLALAHANGNAHASAVPSGALVTTATVASAPVQRPVTQRPLSIDSVPTATPESATSIAPHTQKAPRPQAKREAAPQASASAQPSYDPTDTR